MKWFTFPHFKVFLDSPAFVIRSSFIAIKLTASRHFLKPQFRARCGVGNEPGIYGMFGL